jgi:hypothetical protein
MGARRGDHDGDLADRDATEAVPEHDVARPEPSPGLGLERTQRLQGGDPVDLVIERGHDRSASSVGADPTGEDDHSSAGAGAEVPLDARKAQRPAGELHRHRLAAPVRRVDREIVAGADRFR